ncbi:hypothetical protein ACPXB3_20820 [Gordonia sp. DT219]|uniref:hypothetical protein n=1 Tax=Gordonia sp. DT219 TaxID=3416658 RepID=UPI003CF71CEE
MVTTGNITNTRLLALVEDHIAEVTELLSNSVFVEISYDRLVAHSSPEREHE